MDYINSNKVVRLVNFLYLNKHVCYSFLIFSLFWPLGIACHRIWFQHKFSLEWSAWLHHHKIQNKDQKSLSAIQTMLHQLNSRIIEEVSKPV